MYYFFQVIFKLILAYTITCVLFGLGYAVYFVIINKEKLDSDKTLNVYSRKLWYIPMVYLSITIIISLEIATSPYNFIKQMIQN